MNWYQDLTHRRLVFKGFNISDYWFNPSSALGYPACWHFVNSDGPKLNAIVVDH
jgi:hypothetical protein